MTFNKDDFKQAVTSMSRDIVAFGREALKLVFSIAVAFTVFGILGYVFFSFFWQSLTVLVMAALCAWFWVELVNAQSAREYDSMVEEAQNARARKHNQSAE